MARGGDHEYDPAAALSARQPPVGQPVGQLPAGRPTVDQVSAGQVPLSPPSPGWFQGGRPGGQPGASPQLFEPHSFEQHNFEQQGYGHQGHGQQGHGQQRGADYGSGDHGSGDRSVSGYVLSDYAVSDYAGAGLALLAGAQQAPSAGGPGSAWDVPATAARTAQPAAQPTAPTAEPPDAQPPRPDGAWPDICDRFGLHLLVLAEQLRASLDELEADEADPERLQRLYQVDHAVTRMRRASRDLRTLAGRSEEELAGFTTSLLDIIRMASSAIERYTQVSIGRVTDLAVLGYAADDVGALMAALLDNATRYSPGTVTVSCHLLQDGDVMFRIEDTGIGIGPDQVTTLNEMFAGRVPEVDDRTGRHTGFPVVHRIAHKHSIGVRLASRPLPSSGMVAMVTLPPHLLCEVPAEEVQRRLAPPPGSAALPPVRPSVVPDLSRRERTGLAAQAPPAAARDEDTRPGLLPRRERASLRGASPRPVDVAAPTPLQQAAARRAFADELSAFSLGAAEGASPAGVVGASPVVVGNETVTDGTVIEEGGQS